MTDKLLTNPKEETVVYLAARGMKPSEIAKATGLSTGYVQSMLNTERLDFEVRQLRYKLHGKDIKKQFQDALPRAVEVAAQIMDDERAKPQLRLHAAELFMDRALGKPKQTIEHEGSLIKKLYDKMDEAKTVSAVIDVEEIPGVEQPIAAAPKKDAMEQWLDLNLGDLK